MVEVRYSQYILQPVPRVGSVVPRFGGVVEVEVDPSNFNWRRRGRGGGEVW